jgi:RNA polymerase sigma factor (sigma-70 family)
MVPASTMGSFEGVLAAARANAPWAYERLWRALSPSVVSYVRLQGAFDPEDLTSEVFLGAFRSIGRFSGNEDQFRGWLFTIAHRRLLDERRRAAVRPTLAGDGDVPDRRAGDVEDDAFRRLAEDRVRGLCQLLPPGQRDVLLLRLVADLTVDQVAAALDRTPGAVKALQRRGLATLRQVLEQEGVPL